MAAAESSQGPTPTDTLYWRDFVRNDDPDIDHPVDQAFIDKTFSKNDYFVQQLLSTKPSSLLSFNDVIKFLLADNSVKAHVYCVADGGFMQLTPDNESWFNPHVRFAVLLCPTSHSPFDGSSWTICVVGSWQTDSQDRFVQVASWDGTQNTFFSRENPIQTSPPQTPCLVGWVYQGNSFDAFADAKAYLGPFNGHVNGAVIMKELHSPWLHWVSPQKSSIAQCCSDEVKQQLKNTPWISKNGDPFGNVETADLLELSIQSGIDKWFTQRKRHDFTNLPSQVGIQRWVAHLLLTTTTNIQPGEFTSIAGKDAVGIPIDFFINSNSQVSGNLTIGLPQPTALKSDYENSVTELGLSLLQEIDPTIQPPPVIPVSQQITLYPGSLGGGKETGEHGFLLYARAQTGEGDGPWTCLIPSLEDTTGVLKMITKIPRPVLLSNKFLQCIFMVDFCNPVYSWRRGVLMQYCPETTSPDGSGTYDLESKLAASISASPNASVQGQPECDFSNWWNNYDPQTTPNTMAQTIASYLSAVKNRLKGKASSQAVLDYARLAESKRRVYRPLPLDEFGFSLPFATQYPLITDLALLEMHPDGTVDVMPARGIQFMSEWTGTLWTSNPQILPTFAAKLGKVALASPSPAPVAAWLLPGKGKSLAVCERSGAVSKGISSVGCPMMAKRSCTRSPARNGTIESSVQTKATFSPPPQPTWPDVQAIFMAPYWLPSDSRSSVGQGWHDAMLYYGNATSTGGKFDLWDEACVKENALTIYQHLRSQSMPITSDAAEFWPSEALETLRSWANQGFRTKESDPVVPGNIIAAPLNPAPTYRTRKDIRSLTENELNVFRSRLDRVLGCQVLGSKWQELCRLHGEWCLHYQEAFSPWHRAYLRYVEELIDFPIPYWNSLDPDVSNPTSPAAGLPQAFLDQTYNDPVSGLPHPNPLLYALPLDGKSTSGSSTITRDPVLSANDRNSADFKTKVQWNQKYQTEFQNALSQALFSYPENVTTGDGSPFSIPWANLPAFKQHMPDADYYYENKLFPYVPNFDGFFEQVHDNGHGWIGGVNGDMSDNAHTAADPIFLVYHANLDRVLDAYLSTHPQAQYTSPFPLKPFTNNAKSLAYDDPRDYIYTTIGDMAKDTRALGYIYAPPFANNGNDILTAYKASHGAHRKSLPTRGGAAVADLTLREIKPKLKLYPQIVFRGVKCTQGSFTIDLFTKDASSHDPSHTENSGFLGRITRLGMGATDPDDPARMGPGDSRCRRTAVTRTVLLTEFAAETIDKVAKEGFVQVVTDMGSGKVVDEQEWTKWDGFAGAFEIGVGPDDGR